MILIFKNCFCNTLIFLGVASVLNKKAGIFVGILFAGLIAAIPLRTYIIMFDIDPKTGFYNGGSSLVTIVNILLFVVTVLLMTPLIIKSYKKLEAAPRRSIAIGIISAVLALTFCINAVYEFYLLASSTGGVGVFINSMLEFAVSAFFISFAVASFKGGRIAFPIASLLPVIWATVHLMAAFMHYTTVVSVSEYLFDMLKMVFVMIFFYYHARFTGRVTNGNELKGMLAFGLPAVFFSLLSILPRYIAFACQLSVRITQLQPRVSILPRYNIAFAYSKTVTFDLPEDLLFVVLSVYIAAVIFVAFFTRNRDTAGAELIDGKSLEAEDTQAGGE
jgi:hypothetical protein